MISASDGEEALSQAHERLPDVILLDMLLPKMSGEEVLRALKLHPDTAPIPVIVLSGLSKQNERKLIGEGAVAYFEKSQLESDVKFRVLLDVIDQLVALPKLPAPSEAL